jgi:hypothetical protein
MKQLTRLGFAVSMIFCVVISATQPALACGPYTLDPIFGFTKHGEYPLSDYTSGKLGIVPTSYGRMSLFVSYRYLTGTPLLEAEQKEVARAIRYRIGIDHEPSITKAPSTPSTAVNDDPVKIWIAARTKLLGGKQEIDTNKAVENQYSYYSNCLRGAFETANKTLKNRTAANHNVELLKEWVRGQDAVFQNCDEISEMPKELPDTSPEWLRKDRKYQIAAAHFYRGALPAARKAFARIAADSSSEWSKTAKYLVARTYIREASFLNSDTKDPEKQRLLSSAAEQLNHVIVDDKMPSLHNSARNLLNLVKLRMDASARTRELANTLSDKAVNSNIYNDLTDYILLLDKIEAQAEEDASKSQKPETEDPESYEDYWTHRIFLRDIPSGKRLEDLTDWLITYQAQDGFEHALEKWNESGKPHWLAAAIAKVRPDHEAADDLIKNAMALPTNSPAYATAMYQAIRVAREAGNSSVAEQLTNNVFEIGFADLPIATRNSFYAQRTPQSKSLSEFLTYAKRKPTGFLWSDDGNESGEAVESLDNLRHWHNRTMFGEDAVEILNKNVPLLVWLNAVKHEQMPGYLRDFVASAGWTRAFLLNDKIPEVYESTY